MSSRRALLCIDGASPERLLDAARALLNDDIVWLPVHVIDTRRERDLEVLRGGIGGAGPLRPAQRESIDSANLDRSRALLHAAEALLRSRGLVHEPGQVRAGEPGRELCAAATALNADLLVLQSSRRAHPAAGPRSVGHTARFVLDHAPCAVLLIRGG